MNYKEIVASIKNKNLKPVYFLTGDEPYYIDKISDEFTKSILKPEQKEFNQIVLYAKDTNVEQIINEAKLFPIGAEKRIVIVKEAQQLKNIELLESYLSKPQKTTVLVIAYKGKKIDKRKKFGKELIKNAIIFESKKFYEEKIPIWITKYLDQFDYKIENSAAIVLTEYLGSNLSKIANELDKLILIVNKKNIITTKTIEQNIGISKDYNIFELQNALGKKDIIKTNRIINHFQQNPKNHHIIPIISSLFTFFQKIMTYHLLEDKGKISVATKLKINPFFVSQYNNAAKNYSSSQLFKIFQFLKEYDLKSKGVNNNSSTNSSLLKELTFKILHS